MFYGDARVFIEENQITVLRRIEKTGLLFEYERPIVAKVLFGFE